MKEKELRLALVCYGGISLAIYMHGVTKEFQKLLRASKLRHQPGKRGQTEQVSYDSLNTDKERETDSERVYFDLLQAIGRQVDLRVIVDIIAGASAGGINGIFLARAIAEDLPLDKMRALWLDNADIEVLLDPSSASHKFSKFYMRPLLWVMNRWQQQQMAALVGRQATQEMRNKLSRFVRSRWFRPPFSGPKFAELLYEGICAMGVRPSTGSLLPPGYPLDLFVTVTDYFGHVQSLRLHSPRRIREREHRLVIGFHDDGSSEDGTRTLGDPADLAFAARATASFPGAFPPATLGEIDGLLAARGQKWVGRKKFIERIFPKLIAGGGDPDRSALIDGSVLNNKPFGEAIAALPFHTAYREVDRRIVYIEPAPSRQLPRLKGNTPGFFMTLRAALSDIPRNQPIRDDLEWIQQHSLRAQRLRLALENMREDVTAAIEAELGAHLREAPLTVDQLVAWRRLGHTKAASAAGYAYAPYVELKVYRVLDDLSLFLSEPAPAGITRELDLDVQQKVKEWAKNIGILPIGRIRSDDIAAARAPWIDLLTRYDIGFRQRRLSFLIKRLNGLYAAVGPDLDHTVLDGIKRKLYEALALLTKQTRWYHAPQSLAFSVRHLTDIALIMAELGDSFNLHNIDNEIDARLVEAFSNGLPSRYRYELLLAYVGYSFFDVATLAMQQSSLQSGVIDDLDEIKVDRISPEDANAIRTGGARSCLKGISFGAFGAFFSRAYRENDYLWGRLHAADRLVDIVLSSVPNVVLDLDASEWKRQLFRAIITEERQHLHAIDEVFARLDVEVG